MKTTSILLIFFLTISSTLFAQKKSEIELNQFKQFVPFLIKGISENKTDIVSEKLNQRTIGLFQKPWLTKKINKEITQKVISSIVKNVNFNVEKDYREKWSLNFYSKIDTNSVIKDVYKSNSLLSNVFVDVSNINIVDNSNNSIIETEERKIKINETTKLNFHSGVINTNFPIKKDYKNVTGTIKLTLKEFEKIDYKEFKVGDENLNFDLGDFKNIKLLKTDVNKAYIYLPKPIKNIEITSTNKDGEMYGEDMIMSIPKNIFDYANGNEITDKSTKILIDNLTIEDLREKHQILVYQTNGRIQNLYIYIKNKPIELISRIIKIKL